MPDHVWSILDHKLRAEMAQGLVEVSRVADDHPASSSLGGRAFEKKGGAIAGPGREGFQMRQLLKPSLTPAFPAFSSPAAEEAAEALPLKAITEAKMLLSPLPRDFELKRNVCYRPQKESQESPSRGSGTLSRSFNSLEKKQPRDQSRGHQRGAEAFKSAKRL